MNIEDQVAEAANRYKFALENKAYDTVYGGKMALRKALFDLVDKWETENGYFRVELSSGSGERSFCPIQPARPA